MLHCNLLTSSQTYIVEETTFLPQDLRFKKLRESAFERIKSSVVSAHLSHQKNFAKMCVHLRGQKSSFMR